MGEEEASQNFRCVEMRLWYHIILISNILHRFRNRMSVSITGY